MSAKPPSRPQAQPDRAERLSDTEERFCHEYLKDLNGTQAYLRVFPSVKATSSRTLAARMLAKVGVQRRIAELQATLHRQLDERNVVSREWVRARLRENVERAMTAEPVRDRQGKETGEYTYQGSVANRALELLGKEMGMFGDKLELTLPTPEEAKRRIYEFMKKSAGGRTPA